jgi:hypothetical protein
MKRIVVMTSTLASSMDKKNSVLAADAWWDSMPKEFKEKYIKNHPKSKYAKMAVKEDDPKDSKGRRPAAKKDGDMRPGGVIKKGSKEDKANIKENKGRPYSRRCQERC